MAAATKDPAATTPPKAEKPATVQATKTDVKVPAPAANQPVAPRTTATRAKPVKVQTHKPPEPKEKPDLVMVRAIEKGFYGLDIDIMVRNPGEIFPMATSSMRKYPLGPGEHPVADAVIIETEKGQFELPGWVELAPEDAEQTASMGHARGIRGQVTADGGRTMDVL